MTKEQYGRRVLDYVRMQIETGNISEYSPLGIAYGDYKRAARSSGEQPAQATNSAIVSCNGCGRSIENGDLHVHRSDGTWCADCA